MRQRRNDLDSIIVKGGRVLNGSVATSGAKNAALPILFSVLLADGTHEFERVLLVTLIAIPQTQELLGHLREG